MPTHPDVPRPAPVPKTLGRSRNLAAIRRADTAPERAIRSALHARGFRFRKDLRLDLASGRVRPDIVFTRAKLAVFVDGCFWHSCPEHGHQPANNEWYWTPKLRRTVERDLTANAVLEAAGWTVVRIWEHTAADEAATSIATLLKSLAITGSTVVTRADMDRADSP